MIATGRDGNRQNAGHVVGRTSNKSKSDDTRSSKTSGWAKNMKDTGRTKKRKDGLSRGDGDVVG